MSRPLARYIPSRRYVLLMAFAFLGALFSAWIGVRWAPSWTAAGLFAASALVLAWLALRPAVEIHETDLRIGRRSISWRGIRRVDQTGWSAPLALRLTLAGGERILLLYPGDLDGCGSLLRHVRRFSRSALLDGIEYRQFWGESPASAKHARDTVTKFPVLPPEEEAEIERMLQRLKTVGRLDSRGSDE